jgi:hypothetical protein
MRDDIDVDDFYGSATLSAKDVGSGKWRCAITGAAVRDIPARDGRPAVRKIELQLKRVKSGEETKPLLLNNTNAMRLKSVLGGRVAHWVGSTFVLQVEQVQFGTKLVDGIRISQVTLVAAQTRTAPPADNIRGEDDDAAPAEAE